MILEEFDRKFIYPLTDRQIINYLKVVKMYQITDSLPM